MLCEKCGTSVSDNETFCAKCKKSVQSRKNKLPAGSSVDLRQFYSHSGKIAPQLVIGIPILLIISTLLAFAYAYSVIYIPIVGYLSFLLTLGFALGVGFCTAIVLQFFKTRNSLFAFCFGLGSGIFALYAAWVTFEYVLLNRYTTDGVELMRLVFNPLGVWNVACLVAEKGWYSIRSTTPTGAVLWTFWAVEACAIVGISAFMSHSFIKDSIFCEACKGWTEDHKNKLTFEFIDESELKEKLINQDLTFLKDVIKVKRTQESFYRINCNICCTCDNLYTLSLLRISRTWDKEGKETEKAKTILKNLFISKEVFTQLSGKKKVPLF